MNNKQSSENESGWPATVFLILRFIAGLAGCFIVISGLLVTHLVLSNEISWWWSFVSLALFLLGSWTIWKSFMGKDETVAGIIDAIFRGF